MFQGRRAERVFWVGVACALGAWFWFWAGRGLWTWFTADDLMNLYAAAAKTAGTHLTLLLTPWSGTPRVLADAVLAGLYGLLGFRPLGFRVFCFLLLGLNLALAVGLSWRLSKSKTAAVAAGLLFAYQSTLSDLYLSTGMIYDLMVVAFVAGAGWWYAGLRAKGRELGWREMGLVGLWTLGAVESKELGVAVVLVVGVLELGCAKKSWRGLAAAGLASAVVVGGILRKGAMAANEAYRMDWSWGQIWGSWVHYQRLMLYQNDAWTEGHAAVFTVVVLGVAGLLWRRAEARLGVALWVLSGLPVLAVAHRSFYAFYLPYLGACLLAGGLVAELKERVFGAGWSGRAVALGALAVWLAAQHTYMNQFTGLWYARMERDLIAPAQVLTRALPKLEPGARVLFVDDPFAAPPEDDWTLLYLVRLQSGDGAVKVKRGRGREAEDWGRYQAVFRLTRERLERLK